MTQQFAKGVGCREAAHAWLQLARRYCMAQSKCG